MRVARIALVEDEAEPLPIRRLTADMVDDWLLGRLNEVWPGKGDAYFLARIADLSRSNDVLLIANDESVLCAARTLHLMSGKPEVMEVFAFSRSAYQTQDGSGNWAVPELKLKPILDLYRYARDWKNGMGAHRMVAGKCSDVLPSTGKKYLGSGYLWDLR